MLKAKTILELFEALSPAEQDKCREVISAAPVRNAGNFKKQRPQLRPEHSTDALMYDLVVRQNGIIFKNTNLQAEKFAKPASQR